MSKIKYYLETIFYNQPHFLVSSDSDFKGERWSTDRTKAELWASHRDAETLQELFTTDTQIKSGESKIKRRVSW